MSEQQGANPQVNWDGKTLAVTLPMQHGGLVEAKWEPSYTFVVHIREAGASEWSFGFETPLMGCTFADLKPDTEYEMQVRIKHAKGLGEPAQLKMRTSPTGETGNVVPFPKK